MRIFLRVASTLLLGSPLLAQTPVPVSTSKEVTLPSATSPAIAPQKIVSQTKVADLPPDTAIVTIQGICDSGSATGKVARNKTTLAARPKTCQTVVTKAQMDAMIETLLPGAAADTRRQFALNYIRTMAASSLALQKRLDHDPTVGKEMAARVQFTQMQVMANSLYRRIEKLAEDVQESELQSYYTGHEADFIQGEVERITISKSGTGATPADPETLKTKAEAIRARAAQGEDFDVLQKEVSQAIHSGAPVPLTKIGMVRRSMLPPAESVVFDLKPGDVTQVVDAPGSLEILKLVSFKQIPLDTVRADLKTALTNGHLQLLMKDATKGVTAKFNLSYLELPQAPELFLTPSLRTPGQPGANAAMAAGGPRQRPGVVSQPASPQQATSQPTTPQQPEAPAPQH